MVFNKRYLETVVKPKIKRRIKDLPKDIAHKRRMASIKLEKKLERRRAEQAKKRMAFEAEKRKIEMAYKKAREKEVIRIAKRRGKKAARIKVKRVGGLRGFARGFAGELGAIREVYGPPRPKKKIKKAKRRKGKKRKSKSKKRRK